jgi:uncharacterized protein with von Willebrand factor type A (vWA) domain
MSDEPIDYAVRLARLGAELRQEGVATSLKDELDAAEALMFIDHADRDELRRALRIALKIPRSQFDTFDRLFSHFLESARAKTEPPACPKGPPPRARKPATERGKLLRWDPDARELTDGDPVTEPQGEEPGYSPEALLRRKRFDQIGALSRDLPAIERLVVRLGRRLATLPSRRLRPTRGPGIADLRASIRRSLRTGGELFAFSRRARPIEKPRLVFLCDTSGSMDAHARFLLLFVLALGRAVRGAEVFALNTELVHVTPLLRRGEPGQVLARMADAVPDWSGGTRLGDSLSTFVHQHLARCVDRRTVVVVLSDGLDRGEPDKLAGAVSAIRNRAKKIIWCNPLLGDPRYEPKARGMSAALPYIDELCPVHDVDSLARLLPRFKV